MDCPFTKKKFWSKEIVIEIDSLILERQQVKDSVKVRFVAECFVTFTPIKRRQFQLELSCHGKYSSQENSWTEHEHLSRCRAKLDVRALIARKLFAIQLRNGIRRHVQRSKLRDWSQSLLIFCVAREDWIRAVEDGGAENHLRRWKRLNWQMSAIRANS